MAFATDDDPLLSWLRSIRQVKQAHPEDKSKLLPHVSDCYREFRDSERYRNDPRFLRVCVQLADCSPESLRIMTELDERGIGHDHALFYEAYATCLEAKRRFGDANIVYKQGLSRHAQPAEKLANSYMLFRDRMDIRKKRKQDQLEKHGKVHCNTIEEGMRIGKHSDHADNDLKQMEACQGGVEHVSKSNLLSTNWYTAEGLDVSFEELRFANTAKKASNGGVKNVVLDAKHTPLSGQSSAGQNMLLCNRLPTAVSFGEETIQIRNFAADAITGKEKDVEDARHHGLVDPTINTKEALQDILSMFCKPLDIRRKKDMGKSSVSQGLASVTAAPSGLLQDNKRQFPEGGLQTQSLEFSVFRDEDDNVQTKPDEAKAGTMSTLPHDQCRQIVSPLGGGSQAQLFSVFKDDEQDQSHDEKGSKAATLYPPHNDTKGQTISSWGGLQARSSEFSIFKDDELYEARSSPASQAQKSSLSTEPGMVEDNISRSAQSEPRVQESGFFVFKDEDDSEEEENGEGRKCKVERSGPERTFFHDCDRQKSNGKSVGINNKVLACGIENLVP